MRIEVDDGYSTEVTDQGTGPALVLVHGTPLDAQAWKALAPQLAERRRVVAYDLRGHGSAAASPLPTSYEKLAADLRRMLDRLEIERAHVLGHSFGGQVAQTFAASFPERLESLTVVCSRSAPFAPFAAAADQVEAGQLAAVAEAALARWFTAPALDRGDPGVRYARSRLADAPPEVFATALRMISGYDSSALLPAIEAPTCWIAAETDTVGAPEHMRRSAELCRDAEFRVVEGVGHMLPVEAPDLLASALPGG